PGAPGVALTWMDAVVDGAAVTPRAGKAVELNALWINGLAAVATIRTRLGRSTDDLDALHGAASASFAARFRHPAGWLCDVVDRPAWSVPSQAPESAPSTDDGSMRPNQLFAFGLPYGPLRGAGPAPVRAIGQALLTPLGLRTLPPDDPAYQARHRGDPAHRDRAYHQGTVWPWLLGAYADAAAATGVATDGLLDGVAAHLADWGVGSISETADAAPPHDATGCPFQAWSVAEVLRVAAEVR
ncbi:MAG TPA: amylo-alpha-1,6-glucosidase, partial [Micromonosporaceae bacterium]